MSPRKFLILVLFASTVFSNAVVGNSAHADENAPDNSKMNQSIQANGEANAQSQGSSASDIELTRRIRRNIVKTKFLSMDAKNIKIISANGQVILKGPVKNLREKNKIEKIAVKIAGENNVRNEIEIE